MNAHHAQRGQTIAFYVFALIASFALTLFVMNYTNTVRWHIRAQNAADEVAMASLAGEAALQNQRTMALYSTTFAEYRVESIAYSMVNAGNGIGTSPTISTATTFTGTCNPGTLDTPIDDVGYDCDNAYDQQPQNYNNAVQQYAESLTALEAVTQNVKIGSISSFYTETVPSAPTSSTAPSAYTHAADGQSCQGTVYGSAPTGAFDCAFLYNADLSQTGPGTKEIADVVACRNVTTQSPGFITFGAAGSVLQPQFEALGRGAATLLPITTAFSPGKTHDPKVTTSTTNYAAAESCAPVNAPAGHQGTCDAASGWMDSSAYIFDPTPLTVQVVFYVPVPTTPPAGGGPTINYCKQG